MSVEVTKQIKMPAGNYAGGDGHVYVGKKGSIAYISDCFIYDSLKEIEDKFFRELVNSGPRTVPDVPTATEVTFE